MAQCHLLQGQPEEALRDLTLMPRPVPYSGKPALGKPMALVATMIHETVTAIYTGVIADGLRSHAWREPQLAALQEQLKEINFLPDMRQALWRGLPGCLIILKPSRHPSWGN